MMSPEKHQWYPAPAVFSIGNGARVDIHLLSGDCRQATIQEIKDRLRRKWGMPSPEEIGLQEVQRELAEHGYSLPDIAASRGDDRQALTEAERLDVERKERGDLSEILAEMAQSEIRGIPEQDIFLVFRRKISIALSEHGMDYIAFKFDDTHEGVFPKETETLVLGESKYTSATSDLNAACRATRSWILDRLTKRRLYTQLTNNAEEYRRHGQDWKSRRALGFIRSIYNRDERLVVSTTTLYSNSVADDKAVSNLEALMLDALDSHKEGAIPHQRFEALLFKVINLQSFCEFCYGDFRCEPQ